MVSTLCHCWSEGSSLVQSLDYFRASVYGILLSLLWGFSLLTLVSFPSSIGDGFSS